MSDSVGAKWGVGGWIWSNSDRLTKWIQTIGLVGAGFWAFYLFYVKDKPSLGHRGSAQIDVLDASTKTIQLPDACSVPVRVSLKNSGLVPITVAKVDVRMWRFTEIRAKAITANEFPRVVDYEAIESTPSTAVPPPSLLHDRRLEPGDQLDDTTTLFLQKPVNEMYLFRVDAEDENGTLFHSGRKLAQHLCP